MAEVTETVKLYEGEALVREMLMVPHDLEVVGTHQIGGFTARGDWFIVDKITNTYDRIYIGSDINSRIEMYEMFVGLAPSAMAYFVSAEAVAVRDEDVSNDETAGLMTWSPREMPRITFQFMRRLGQFPILHSITDNPGGNSKGQTVRHEYQYHNSESRLPTSMHRLIVRDEAAARMLASVTGTEPSLTSEQTLRLVGFAPIDSPTDIYVDTSTVRKFDSEEGKVFDGEGGVLFEYQPPKDPVTARQWSTIGVLVGLSGIVIAVGIVIYRRVRA